MAKRVCEKVDQVGANRRSIMWIIARCTQASDVSGRASKSLLNLRHLPIHASVRSTTHLLGKTSK